MTTKAKLVYSREGLLDLGVRYDARNSSNKVGLVSLTEESGKRFFVAVKNFYAITRYNPSTNYAMAVTELSEAISKAREGQ